MELDDTKLTRVTLINEDGIVFERYGCEVEVLTQDEDRTLKVFVRGSGRKFLRDLA